MDNSSFSFSHHQHPYVSRGGLFPSSECVAGGRTLSSTCDSLNSLDLASAMLGVRVSARLGSLLVGTVPLCFSISASTLECVCAMEAIDRHRKKNTTLIECTLRAPREAARTVVARLLGLPDSAVSARV